MHNIGNDHDARTILLWVRSHPGQYSVPKCAIDGEAPKGWEFLGKGSFRSVWRSPEGVAYKVNHSTYDYQSEREVENLQRAWKREPFKGCRLPRFDRFDIDDEVVVAQEAVDGPTLYRYAYGESDTGYRSVDSDDLYGMLNTLSEYYGIADMHDENVLVDEEGLLVPVDFGV